MKSSTLWANQIEKSPLQPNTPSRPVARWWIFAGAAAVLFVAFVLRVSGLGSQSLWYDEGFSVYLSRQPIPDLIRLTAQDIHPPLYYLLLQGWKELTGETEFALRYLSLVFGVLLVAAVGAATRRASRSQLAALIAAGIAAIAPANVWYSQETRMYSLLALLTALSCERLIAAVSQFEAFGRVSVRPVAAWTLFNVLLAYTHSFGLFVIAAQGVGLTVWWMSGRARWKTIPLFGAGFALTALAFVPWMFPTLGRLDQDESFLAGTLDPFLVVAQVRQHLIAGPTVEGIWVQIAVAATQILTLAGIVVFRRRLGANLVLVSGLLIPLLLLLAISWNRPKYQPRYLYETIPPLQVLMGPGAAGLLRTALRPRVDRKKTLHALAVGSLALLGGGLGAAWVTGLASMYTDTKFARDDWRAAVADLAMEPGDGVILVSGHAFPVFEYYYGNRPYLPLPAGRTLSVRNTLGFDVADQLNSLRATASRFWIVRWQDDVVDPNGYLRRVLETAAVKEQVNLAPHGVGIERYLLKQGEAFRREPNIEHPAPIDFDKTIALLGYENGPGVSDQNGTIHVAAGEASRLTLFWKAVKPLTADYKVFLRLVDFRGNEWDRTDQRPANYSFLTTRWKPGEVVFGDLDIPVRPGTPPGQYRLEVGLYAEDGSSVRPLDVLNSLGARSGQFSTLANLVVDDSGRAQPAVAVHRRIDRPMESVTLVGATQQEDLGIVRPGDTIPIGLFWTRRTSAGTTTFDVTFDGATASPKPLTFPFAEGWPVDRWADGSVWRGVYRLAIPADIAPGQYSVTVHVGRESAAAFKLTVDPVNRLTQLPAVTNGADVSVGDFARYRGYDIDDGSARPGGSVKYTLYWVATKENPTSLSGFVHILNASGQVVAQRDAVPGEGTLPTTGWLPGQVIIDPYSITLPSGLAPGAYQVEIGLYDPVTGKRIQIDGADQLHLKPLIIR